MREFTYTQICKGDSKTIQTPEALRENPAEEKTTVLREKFH